MSNSEQKLGVVLDNAYLRLGTVAAVMAAVFYGTTTFTEMRIGLDSVVTRVEAVADEQSQVTRDLVETKLTQGEIKRTVERLDKKIVGKGPNGWHRPDMKQLCRETALKNPGWECGSTQYDGD